MFAKTRKETQGDKGNVKKMAPNPEIGDED